MKFLIKWIFHQKNKMESVWNGNGKGMEKLIRSKLGEMEWNWNGTFIKKFGDEKQNENREEMEKKWNGKRMKKFVDEKWSVNRGKWNGKKEKVQ